MEALKLLSSLTLYCMMLPQDNKAIFYTVQAPMRWIFHPLKLLFKFCYSVNLMFKHLLLKYFKQ